MGPDCQSPSYPVSEPVIKKLFGAQHALNAVLGTGDTRNKTDMVSALEEPATYQGRQKLKKVLKSLAMK